MKKVNNILLMIIMLNTSVFGQDSIIGDWIFKDHIFSFKEKTVELIPFNVDEKTQKSKIFEIEIFGDKIIVLNEQIAFDTLHIISKSKSTLVLFQHSMEKELILKRSTRTTSKENLNKFHCSKPTQDAFQILEKKGIILAYPQH